MWFKFSPLPSEPTVTERVVAKSPPHRAAARRSRPPKSRSRESGPGPALPECARAPGAGPQPVWSHFPRHLPASCASPSSTLRPHTPARCRPPRYTPTHRPPMSARARRRGPACPHPRRTARRHRADPARAGTGRAGATCGAAVSPSSRPNGLLLLRGWGGRVPVSPARARCLQVARSRARRLRRVWVWSVWARRCRRRLRWRCSLVVRCDGGGTRAPAWVAVLTGQRGPTRG